MLEYFTLLWNIIGCGIILTASFSSHSISLFGFGIDSIIEIFASVIVVWQLKAINKEKEKIAEKLIGFSFILLSLYILCQSYIGLTEKTRPGISVVGILFLTLTIIAMFALSYGKKVIGRKLNNSVLMAEAKVTAIDGLLALSVLTGLLLNTCFGFWWADATAGLVIVFYGVREAMHIFNRGLTAKDA